MVMTANERRNQTQASNTTTKTELSLGGWPFTQSQDSQHNTHTQVSMTTFATTTKNKSSQEDTKKNSSRPLANNQGSKLIISLSQSSSKA